VTQIDLPRPLLRPGLTRALAARLEKGASINLSAAHGLGRRRTVADLRSILPAAMRVLYIDMRFCAADFPATLHDLCTQSGLKDVGMRNLGEFIAALADNPAPALLILHNVDLLRDAPHDPLFDTALLPYLARIAEYPHLALLAVSEAVHPDWPLPCEHFTLPPQEGCIARI
jgi:hypothetical protein